MKQTATLLALSLLLVAGDAIAADPPKTTTQPEEAMDHSQMQHGQMDHSKMNMSGEKSVDHQKMAADEFAVLDKNKDGKLSKAELAKDSPIRPHFEMLDADKNGSLSSKEFAAHHGM